MTTRAVIFDLWGTLVDEGRTTWIPTAQQMAATLGVSSEALTRAWADTRLARSSGQLPTITANVEAIAGLLNIAPSRALLEQATEAHRAYVRAHCVLRPDALETFQRLHTRGLPLGLITNCGPEEPAIVEAGPLGPLLTFGAFSFRVGLLKPDLRIFQLCAAKLGVPPQDCLYVADGDSNEFTGATAAGLRPLLIRMDYSIADSFRFTAAQWPGPRISFLSEVLDHLL